MSLKDNNLLDKPTLQKQFELNIFEQIRGWDIDPRILVGVFKHSKAPRFFWSMSGTLFITGNEFTAKLLQSQQIRVFGRYSAACLSPGEKRMPNELFLHQPCSKVQKKKMLTSLGFAAVLPIGNIIFFSARICFHWWWGCFNVCPSLYLFNAKTKNWFKFHHPAALRFFFLRLKTNPAKERRTDE